MKKNNLFTIVYGLGVLTLLPSISFAAFQTLRGLLSDFKDILRLVEPILFGLAFLYFFYGMGQFILKSGDQKARDEGKQKMLWGVIALFVMLSIMGILSAVGGLVGIPTGSSGTQPDFIGDPSPGIPGQSNG